MIDLQIALVDALRAIPALVTATGYSSTRLSISMANPDQLLLKPGLYAEFDEDPLPASDSSKLKKSDVSLYALAPTRKACVEMQEIIREQFYDVEGKEKKFDISNGSVLCIGSYWATMQSPRWNKDIDCFEALIVIEVIWSPK